MRFFCLIAYDIVSDTKRRQAENLVQRFAVRVQDSVYEGNLTRSEITQLLDSARRLLEPATNSLRLYRLCAGCARDVDCVGVRAVAQVPPEVIV